MPNRSNFFSVHLAAEATAIATKIAAYLATFIHITLSFDGWSSKGLILTGLSTAGDALFGYLSDVCMMCVLFISFMDIEVYLPWFKRELSMVY